MTDDLLPLATYCFLMSSTPGPNNVMLTASGARFGYRGSLPHILGISVGGAVQTLLSCLGLGALFAAAPALQAVQAVLRGTGALYLLWLAWRLLGGPAAEGRIARPLSFSQGAWFQAVNPKSWMKAVTLAAVFLPPGWGPLQGALLLAGVGLAVGFPCISAWALFGVAIRRWLTSARRQRGFNAIMAASLAVLAFRLLL